MGVFGPIRCQYRAKRLSGQGEGVVGGLEEAKAAILLKHANEAVVTEPRAKSVSPHVFPLCSKPDTMFWVFSQYTPSM